MKLLHHARIHTLDPKQPRATALAVEGDRICAVGGDELAEVFPSAESQDMEGKVILPGLTDAHLHLQELALSASIIQCDGISREECLQRVSRQAERTKPGQWIRGHGWNQNDWGGAWPSAADLDEVAPGAPVYLTAKSLHAAWVNTRALKLAGIEPSTPDPAHGEILRNQQGAPLGILLEAAMKLAESVIPDPAPAALADTLRNVVIPELWRVGLTGVHDFDKRSCFQALQILHEHGTLNLRVLKSIPLSTLPAFSEAGLRSGFGSETLRIGPVKAFADGALGPHTAAMFEPYLDDSGNRGMLILDADGVYDLGCRAAVHGISLSVHAIGDRAVHEVVSGMERLRKFEEEGHLPALRHRIEHVQVCRLEDAQKMAKLGIIASMQPCHAPSDMDAAESTLGDRGHLCYAWRMQLEVGTRLAFGSDAPVESANPFRGLHAAVTRQRRDGSPGPQGWHGAQRLKIGEALEAFTRGPAYAARLEGSLGCLAVGFLADLIVLDQDPFTCSPDELWDLVPESTMVGGNWVWQK